MNQTLQAPRLDRLRQGLDLAVERLYIQKARKGLPVVVAAPSGDPCRISAERPSTGSPTHETGTPAGHQIETDSQFSSLSPLSWRLSALSSLIIFFLLISSFILLPPLSLS